jgi:hypothetical protein
VSSPDARDGTGRLVLPDPSLVVITGGPVDELRHAASSLFRAGELHDPDRVQPVELLGRVERRLRGLRLAAVLDARGTPELRRELARLGKRHCLPRLAVLVRCDSAPSEEVLRGEGFARVEVVDAAAELTADALERRPLGCDRRGESGPFDVIGDVHGCFDELVELLGRLGHGLEAGPGGIEVRPPARGRPLVLGDLVDRGPRVPEVLSLVLNMTESGAALCVPGNHEMKLGRALAGQEVKPTHGLAESLSQLESAPAGLAERFLLWLEGLPSHLVLDGGRLVAAHAGLEERHHGRESRSVWAFALYGKTTGEVDAVGHPLRLDWADGYRGSAHVVYGHTPVREARWVNRTLNLDTGCVFGGALSALRWPEGELVSVPAARAYWDVTGSTSE